MPWTPLPSFRVGSPPHTTAEWNALVENANFFFDLAALEQSSCACIMRRVGVTIAFLITSSGTTVTVPLPEPPASGRAVCGLVHFLSADMFNRVEAAFCVIRNGSGGTDTWSTGSPTFVSISIEAGGTLTISHAWIDVRCAGWFVIQTQ